MTTLAKTRFRSTDLIYDAYASSRCLLCQFGKRYMHMESYAGSMDDATLRYKLTIPLIEKDYGDTAAEVLKTCALVAEYAQEHTPDQVKAYQERVGINSQVWLRLLALHRDERLKKRLVDLPASYTALYAVSRMKDEEIEAAIQQGIIHPSASSHSILAWSKNNRLTRGEAVPPWRCLVVFDKEITEDEFKAMIVRINRIAVEYGGKLIGESDYVRESPEVEKKTQLIAQLEQEIRELATPVFESMTEVKRSYAGISVIDDFLFIDLMSFAFVTRPKNESQVALSRTPSSTLYVYRVALEFLRTDSRSQRFNYKRRLKQLVESQPELAECIDQVIKTYMTR